MLWSKWHPLHLVQKLLNINRQHFSNIENEQPELSNIAFDMPKKLTSELIHINDLSKVINFSTATSRTKLGNMEKGLRVVYLMTYEAVFDKSNKSTTQVRRLRDCLQILLQILSKFR